MEGKLLAMSLSTLFIHRIGQPVTFCLSPMLIHFFFVVERYTEIERENRILLEKMTNIL